MLEIAQTTPNQISPTITKYHIDDRYDIHTQCEKKNSSFLLCLKLLERSSKLPSLTIGFLSFVFAATNLHIVPNLSS